MSAAREAAFEVAERFCSPALLNHSMRSYLWGVAYARAHGIAFDDELYFVASLLHDIGLTPTFDSHELAFEEAGGAVAWVLGAGAGWSAERRARVDEIVVLHMREDVAASVDAESHLLQVATSWDVSGGKPEEFPETLRAEVVERWPRLRFGAEFLAACSAQAERKPESAAAEAIESGIAGRIAANPLDA